VSEIDVNSYIDRLRQALPYVPPISVQRIRALHRKRDLGGVVKLLRKTMNVNVSLTLHWTEQVRGSSPAWVSMPTTMPYYGTPEFGNVRIDMFIRKSFAESRPYDEFAIAVAHEFSHVVLDSIHHPLRREEKAVDLTAMILGFSYIYRRAAHTSEHVSRYKVINRTLGYLSKPELDAACRVLVPAKMRAKHLMLVFLETNGLILVLGALSFVVWAIHALQRN
jgi:hypothetical protein